jgi:hypothetical protein
MSDNLRDWVDMYKDDFEQAKAALDQVTTLHAPAWERDFVAIPAHDVLVCGACYSGSDGFHVDWPCETIQRLITAEWLDESAAKPVGNFGRASS